RLGNAGLPAGKSRLDRSDWMHVVVISLAMIPLVYGVLGAWNIVGPTWAALPGLGKLAVTGVVVAALWFGGSHLTGRKPAEAEPLTAEEWQRIIAILVMGFFVIFFWMGFEQAGGTMNLFADKLTDRNLFGWEIPASYFQAINPLAILALGPVMAALWLRVDQSRFRLPTPAKMAFGLVFLGLGFVVLAFGDARAQAVGMVGPQWLAIVYVLH